MATEAIQAAAMNMQALAWLSLCIEYLMGAVTAKYLKCNERRERRMEWQFGVSILTNGLLFTCHFVLCIIDRQATLPIARVLGCQLQGWAEERMDPRLRDHATQEPLFSPTLYITMVISFSTVFMNLRFSHSLVSHQICGNFNLASAKICLRGNCLEWDLSPLRPLSIATPQNRISNLMT